MTTQLDSLRALHDAVKAGKYDRKGSVPRYYDFGEDSEGILPGTRMGRMSVLLGGKDAAIEHLAALIADAEAREGEGA